MAAKPTSNELYPRSDEELRDWYEKYFPKGHESLINLFTADRVTNVAQKPSSSLATSTQSSKTSVEAGKQTEEKKHRKKTKFHKVKYCVYCRRNDEMPSLYNSHRLHDRNGNVVCPVLREKVCEFCGSTGNAAHTPKYCPKRPKPIWESLSN